MTDQGDAIALQLDGVEKSYGAVRALAGLSLTLKRGEALGLVGHNGAGKSTLMHVLAGVTKPDTGTIRADGARIAAYDTAAARRLGVRCIFQELSLCPNLSVAENVRAYHPGLPRRGWRKRVAEMIRDRLDAIFPGHGIDPDMVVGDLPIGRRQMVEIARAFTVVDRPIRLVILDEPTSSLDAGIARQLMDFLARARDQGIATVFISHILNEVLSVSGRVVVMREGRVVLDAPAHGLTRDALVRAMGGAEDAAEAAAKAEQAAEQAVEQGASAAERPRIAWAAMPGAPAGPTGALALHEGEVVGLAGLAGHGQTAMLLRLAGTRDAQTKVERPVAFVAGDRQADGVFPLWSITRNMTIRSLGRSLGGLSRWGLIDPGRERALAADWQRRIAIRTPDLELPIGSLSGGNQQKVLFARALASDAGILLMDDPMRGVDVATKHDVYRLIRAEAERGRAFLWYTTEMEELFQCDRVYVFHQGRITAHLTRAGLTEQAILNASYETGGETGAPRAGAAAAG